MGPTLRAAPGVEIPESELNFEFVRSSGPGGQNVNKVATAVQLRFDLDANRTLADDVKARLRKLAGRRLTDEGVLILRARRFRSQEKNRRDVISRLVDLLRRAAVAPTRRRPTKPTSASRRRRLDTKRHRSRVKRSRGRPSGDGDGAGFASRPIRL